jgi:hypothetical protein
MRIALVLDSIYAKTKQQGHASTRESNQIDLHDYDLTSTIQL